MELFRYPYAANVFLLDICSLDKNRNFGSYCHSSIVRHAMVYISGEVFEGETSEEWMKKGFIALFGGTTDGERNNPNKLLDDFWIYSVALNQWKQLTPVNSPPTPRQGHYMTAVKSQVILELEKQQYLIRLL